MNEKDVYLIAARRTPIGSFLGSLSQVTAPELGSIALRAALSDSGLTEESIDEVYMGNVLSAGLGQAPARQAALGADLPVSVPSTTVSKVCGSGLMAVILGRRAILSGEAEIVACGGMESMSRAPHYLSRLRSGQKMGHSEVIDGMLHDGLWDPYNNFHMGEAAEMCAEKYGYSRERQDAFAAESYRRALDTQKSGGFRAELAPVVVKGGKGKSEIVNTDEEPGRADLSKFPSLRPAFQANGTITAANASSLNDGAAAVVLASAKAVRERQLTPLARIISTGAGAQSPEWFTTAPILAANQALARAGLSASDIELWEINEAFSCVTLAVAERLHLNLSQVNVRGGAVALGHPIGASGARILVTLVHALRAEGKSTGLATLCIGGGEAVSVVVERV